LLPKLDVEGLSKLALAVFVSADVCEYGDDKRLMTAAKAYGVDVAAVKATVKAEEKAKVDKAAAEKPAKKKAKKR
jgi:hypothetical protein